jgi:uncharacterized membrane protein YbhN (UPF0104 family)
VGELSREPDRVPVVDVGAQPVFALIDSGTDESPSGRLNWANFPRRRAIFALVGALILFVVVIRQVRGVDLGQIWARIRAADGPLLALALVVFYCSFLCRTLRWRALLENVGFGRGAGRRLPSLFGLLEILYLSWFANCVTVARLGDAYRGHMLKKAAGVSFGVTLGTILAERLIDLTILVGLMAGTALFVFHGTLPPEAVRALLGGLGIAAIGGGGLLALRPLRPVLARALPTRLHAHYASLEGGLLGSFRRLPLLAGYSVLGWAIEGTTLYLTAAAVGAPVSPAGALMVALIASLLTTIPLAPSGLGVTEAGMVVVLGWLGIEPSTAGAIALLNRCINYWSIVAFGAILYAVSRKK